MEPLPFLADVALRAALLLAMIFGLLYLMKRASAAERHLVLLLGLVVVILLPVGMLASPELFWSISLPAPKSRPTVIEMPISAPKQAFPAELNSVSIAPAATPSLVTPANAIVALLIAGVLAQLVILGRASHSWRRIRRSALPARVPADMLEQARAFAGSKGLPPVLVSDEISVPVLAGWLRPTILLPRAALEGPRQPLAMMLCHELAHFRRGDSRLLPLLALARVLYWWHPLVWIALARLRRERESACDDLVLGQNFRATDYADLIVNAARALKAARSVSLGALAMASSSVVGGRVTAVLDPALRRQPAHRFAVWAGLGFAWAGGWILAATQIRAADQPAPPTAPLTSGSAKRGVLLEFKLAAIDEKTYAAQKTVIDAVIKKSDLLFLINLIQHDPGNSLLSAPSVTTREGLKANVDILREFPYPPKTEKDKMGKAVPSTAPTRETGLSITALPTVQADGKTVDLDYQCKLVDFGGWKETAPGVKSPIFNTRSINAVRQVIPEKGFATWVGSGPFQNQSFGNIAGDGMSKDDPSPKRILLLIFARVVPPEPAEVIRPNQSDILIKTALKFFQINEKSYAQQPAAIDAALQRGDTAFLGKIRDFNMLSEPTALSKPGEQWTTEAGRTITPPSGSSSTDGKPLVVDHGRRFIGIRVVVKSDLSSQDTIVENLSPEMTRYDGLIQAAEGGKMPVFNTRRENLKLEVRDGSTKGFWLEQNTRDMDWSMTHVPDRTATFKSLDKTPVRVGLIVSTDLCSKDGQLLRNPQSRRARPIDKFKTLTFRKIDFHQATLATVIQGLTVESKKADPDHEGLNFVLNMSPATEKLRVDLELENVSPKAVLDSIVRQTGLTYAIDDYAVYLRPPLSEEAFLMVRTFSVPDGFTSFLKLPAGTSGDVHQALASRGIVLGTGASALYLPDKKSLVVRDTPAQLDQIDALLKSAGVSRNPPP